MLAEYVARCCNNDGNFQIMKENSHSTLQLFLNVIMIIVIMTIIAIPLGICKNVITTARHKIPLSWIQHTIARPMLAAILWILPKSSGSSNKIRNHHEERWKKRL